MNKILIKKALSSTCCYRVAAIAFDRKGDALGTASNKFRLSGKGGGLHAEQILMSRYGKNIKTITICRVNASGNLLPIEPCKKCSKIANKLNIKIVSLRG